VDWSFEVDMGAKRTGVVLFSESFQCGGSEFKLRFQHVPFQEGLIGRWASCWAVYLVVRGERRLKLNVAFELPGAEAAPASVRESLISSKAKWKGVELQRRHAAQEEVLWGVRPWVSSQLLLALAGKDMDVNVEAANQLTGAGWAAFLRDNDGRSPYRPAGEATCVIAVSVRCRLAVKRNKPERVSRPIRSLEAVRVGDVEFLGARRFDLRCSWLFSETVPMWRVPEFRRFWRAAADEARDAGARLDLCSELEVLLAAREQYRGHFHSVRVVDSFDEILDFVVAAGRVVDDGFAPVPDHLWLVDFDLEDGSGDESYDTVAISDSLNAPSMSSLADRLLWVLDFVAKGPLTRAFWASRGSPASDQAPQRAEDLLFCDHCGYFALEDEAASFVRCDACQVALYCSAECREAEKKAHETQCAVLARLPTDDQRRLCALCGLSERDRPRRRDKFKTCASCRVVKYCSKACHTAHWQGETPVTSNKDRAAQRRDDAAASAGDVEPPPFQPRTRCHRDECAALAEARTLRREILTAAEANNLRRAEISLEDSFTSLRHLSESLPDLLPTFLPTSDPISPPPRQN